MVSDSSSRTSAEFGANSLCIAICFNQTCPGTTKFEGLKKCFWNCHIYLQNLKDVYSEHTDFAYSKEIIQSFIWVGDIL